MQIVEKGKESFKSHLSRKAKVKERKDVQHEPQEGRREVTWFTKKRALDATQRPFTL